MSRARTVQAIALGTTVILAAACRDNPETIRAAPREPETVARTDRRVPVRTRRIVATSYQETVEVSGTVRPWVEVELAAEFGGMVREVGFEKGENVSEGRVLARIGDDLAEVQLAQGKADLMEAEANYTKVSKLAEREAVPKQDLVTATATRERVAAMVRELELRLERSIIRAPIAGVALDRSIEPGEFVAPGAKVTTLQQIDRLKVEAAVPDTEIPWLSVGQPAAVRVDAWPRREFPARIRFVSPSADPDSRTFNVEMELPNRERTLRPGMVARVELKRRQIDAAVAVPRDALVTKIDGQVAFVIEDCRAVLRRVETAGDEGDLVLVAAGLQPGEELVVSGQRDLADGQEVETEACR